MAKPMVVGVDGTADSLAALSSPARLAEESGAGLVVVHLRHEGAVASAASNVEAGAEAAIYEALDEVERTSRERVADVLAGRRVQWRFDVASGDPATELITVARGHQATTIVVGGRTQGVVGGLVVGSVAQKLVRHSPVSVLVVRDGQAHRLEVASSGGHSSRVRIPQRERRRRREMMTAMVRREVEGEAVRTIRARRAVSASGNVGCHAGLLLKIANRR